MFWQGVFQTVHDLLIKDRVIHPSQVTMLIYIIPSPTQFLALHIPTSFIERTDPLPSCLGLCHILPLIQNGADSLHPGQHDVRCRP